MIGCLAKDKDIPLGSWRAQAEEASAVSLLEGIEAAVGKENVQFAEGYKLTTGSRSFLYELDFVEDDESGFEEALEVAKKSEVVIMAMGEDCWQSGEGRSQADIGLKGNQQKLLRKVAEVNSQVVVVLMSGRSLVIPQLTEQAKALLQVWHLGSEAGNAIADVLFGDYNPSGKLPVSFPRHGGQVPVYYNHKNTGRPTTNAHDDGMVFWSHYTDVPNSPLYCFGFGLSYTSFEYANLSLSSRKMNSDEIITATVDVTNTGEYDGYEVVQLYIRDQVASVTRPVKELKGFQKVLLKSGEKQQVSFKIDTMLLSFYDNQGVLKAEPGKFTIMVGGNSDDLQSQEMELR